ncbi:MAG: hypothetical protein R6U89_05025 [Dehalococcoidia bacterium]
MAGIYTLRKWIGALRGHTLARARNISWGDIQAGEITVSMREVCVYQKGKPYQLWKKPAVITRVPTVLINSIEVRDENTLLIHRVDQNDVPVDDVIVFEKRGEAQNIAACLEFVLDEMGGEDRQARVERAERERRESEERARREELEALWNEKKLVWTTAANVWRIVMELGQVMKSLRNEDWDLIDSSWHRIRVLEEGSVLGISEYIESVSQVIHSKAADQLYVKILELIQLLPGSLEAIRDSRFEQEGTLKQYEIAPRWGHLPYFLLFAAIYTESIICYKAGDDQGARDDVEWMQRLAMILRNEFGLELEDHIALFEAALSTRDYDQVLGMGEDMENYVIEIIDRKMEASYEY